MKIAFTGMSSTGKTTTANNLMESTIFCNLNILLLRTTDTRKNLTSPIDEMSEDERLSYQKLRLEEKIRTEEKKTNFLVERSFIDLLAYRKQIPIPLTRDEEEIYLSYAREYDIHFFFPPSIVPYICDGKRPSVDFSKKTSEIIYDILNINNIPYIELTVPLLSERCDIICKVINQIKEKRKYV